MLLDEQIFGIYRAIVTDVSCFEATGKIKTRISAFHSGSVTSNLLNGYDSNTYADVTSRDILTDIILPFGGGYNYGMFKLPQINSVGLVAFINGSRSLPIWLGSTANSLFNSSNELVESDIPSDRDNNYPAKYYDEDEEKSVFNFDDANAFIIKTKKNYLDEFTNPETMNWQNNPVENSFVLSSAKASLYHRVNDDSYQEFILSNDSEKGTGSISIGYVISEDEFKRITANDDSITIRNKNGNVEAQITLDDEGGIFIDSYEDTTSGNKQTGSRVEASIKMTPASIELKSGGCQVSMSRNINENNEKLLLKASKVQILAKDISLGSSGYSLVVSPNPNLNFTLEDGSMLSTASNIRV